MFNRSQIMKAAWVAYRAWHASGLRTYGKMSFDRWKFSAFLRFAWEKARTAVMAPVQRRRVAIEKQIEMLAYKSFRYNTPAMESRLRAELAALA